MPQRTPARNNEGVLIFWNIEGKNHLYIWIRSLQMPLRDIWYIHSADTRKPHNILQRQVMNRIRQRQYDPG